MRSLTIFSLSLGEPVHSRSSLPVAPNQTAFSGCCAVHPEQYFDSFFARPAFGHGNRGRPGRRDARGGVDREGGRLCGCGGWVRHRG